MNEAINEKVSVVTSYNWETGLVIPRKVRWQGKEFIIKKMTYYHRVREGRNLLHIFHVTDGATDFRLRLDSGNLHWTLEEICDGTSA